MNATRVVTGSFALIVLYTVLTHSDKVAGFLGTSSTAVMRFGDPTVPLIPDLRKASSTASTAVTTTGSTGSGIAPGTVIPPGQIMTHQ